jgi:hypothetical protein
MTPPNKNKFRYDEDKYIKEVLNYVLSTYEQHYVGKDELQVLDYLHSLDDAESFCRGNVIKYVARYGRKYGRNRADLIKAIHYVLLLLHFTEDDVENKMIGETDNETDE